MAPVRPRPSREHGDGDRLRTARPARAGRSSRGTWRAGCPVRARRHRSVRAVDPCAPTRGASALHGPRRDAHVAGELHAQRRADPRGEARPSRRPDRDLVAVRRRPRRTRRAGHRAVAARRSGGHRRSLLLDADGEGRGPWRRWGVAGCAVRVRARARRGPVPRRRCRGIAGAPRRRAGSVRGGPGPRAVGRCPRELSPVRGAPVRLLRSLCRTRRVHPHPGRRAGRGCRSTGATRRRRDPRQSERERRRVAPGPAGRDDPHRPPVGLPFRWVARASSRAALAHRLGHRALARHRRRDR